MVFQNPLLVDANAPFVREAMTGMRDDQLAQIGYISVLWNAMERNLVACIWVVARWTEEVGEIVTADIGNNTRADMLMNLVKLNVDDPKLNEQTTITLALYDLIRGARNDLMHGFYNWRHIGLQPRESLSKLSAKKRTGVAEMKVIPVSLEHLQQIANDLHVCNESFNDLYHKFFFRNRWVDGCRGPLEHNYEDAVHGWRAPSFETAFVQEALTRRSRLLNPPRSRPQPKASQAKSRPPEPPAA